MEESIMPDMINPLKLASGLLMSLVLAASSLLLKLLDTSGCIALILMGTIVFGIGGWPFSAPILCFFISSSFLSKISESRRSEIHASFQKSSRRDAIQVLANGGIATGLIVLWLIMQRPIFYFLFVGAVAAVTADTWATEIGVWGGRRPRSIISWQRVSPGTSGGITAVGVLGAVAGATTIACAAWTTRPAGPGYKFDGVEILILSLCGVLANFLDSILGATIQAQYRCTACGSKTERLMHCNGSVTVLDRGLRWMNNDAVNGVCALSGAMLVYAML
jgi:uncharacterized protein (TIGR00297 family)